MAKKDTIVAHCIARAVVAEAGGEEAAKERYGEHGEVLRSSSAWKQLRIAARVTPKASRVASFIAIWGVALYDLDRDEISVDEYAEWANESRATAFRRAAEYRELWPEVDVNDLARMVRDHIRRNGSLKRNPARLTSLVVAV